MLTKRLRAAFYCRRVKRALNGKDSKIKLQELDPLHYLVSEAIEYSMAAFDLMKQEDESETETSTADTSMLKMLTRLQLKAVQIWR